MLRRFVKKSVDRLARTVRPDPHRCSDAPRDVPMGREKPEPLVTSGVQIGPKPSERPREGLPPRDPSQSPEAFIKKAIEDNPILLFVKGSPSAPACGFSAQTMGIFQQLGVPFQTVNVLEDYEVREEIKAFSNWPTIPQVYLRGEFIGGCDIITQLYESGELATMVKPEAERAT